VKAVDFEQVKASMPETWQRLEETYGKDWWLMPDARDKPRYIRLLDGDESEDERAIPLVIPADRDSILRYIKNGYVKDSFMLAALFAWIRKPGA
jgi:hypothetical protein